MNHYIVHHQSSCRSVVSNSLQPHGLQNTRPPCPSPTPGACSNSRPLSRRCYPTIPSPIVASSSSLQSFPASGSFPMSQLLTWGGQSTGAPVSTPVPPMNIQDWSPSGWTGWISPQSKGLSRVLSSTTVQGRCSIFWLFLSNSECLLSPRTKKKNVYTHICAGAQSLREAYTHTHIYQHNCTKKKMNVMYLSSS